MVETEPATSRTELKRTLSLGLVALYGLGTTIGAGIFVLIGKVGGAGGDLAPVSFLVAAAVAVLSALSFAELSVRYPESGGEAVYVKEGLNSTALALSVGLMVVAAGVISTATIVVGFSGYLAEFTAAPRNVTEVAVAICLAAVAASGVRISISLAALITVLEIAVLAVVIGLGTPEAIGDGAARMGQAIRSSPLPAWSGVIAGAVIAFYAFIGFEDIVNVAEETRNPEKVLPAAILITLAGTTLLYVLVSLVALGSVAPGELMASDAPLSLLFERLSGLPGEAVSAIAIVSVLNGALIQMIMASRVLYGLSRRGWLPGPFGDVNARTRTPAKATLFCLFVVAGLVLTLDLERLATAASYVTLIVFALVNTALIATKFGPAADTGEGFRVPRWVPVLGVVLIAGLIVSRVAG